MILILLLAALLLPPVFILSPPWRRLSPKTTRVRLALSIIVVWGVAILWSLSNAAAESDPSDYQVSQRNFSDKPPPRQKKETEQEEDPAEPGSRKARTAPKPSRKPTASRPARSDAEETPATQPSVALQHGADGDQDIAWDWSVNAPLDTGWMLLLGWIPGLAYAGLLFLARRGLEPRETQLIEGYGDPRRYRGPW